MAILLTLITIIISRMISTEYAIYTEGYMEIKKGRFTSNTNIQLSQIKRIDKIRRGGTLIIVMNDDKEYYLIPPKNEEDFIRCIEKYRS